METRVKPARAGGDQHADIAQYLGSIRAAVDRVKTGTKIPEDAMNHPEFDLYISIEIRITLQSCSLLVSILETF